MDLDEFDKQDEIRPGYTAACDRLPEEVREKILTSNAGHATVRRWLIQEHGITLSEGRIGDWRRKHGWTKCG